VLADLNCADAQTPSYQASTTSWVCVSPSAVFDADNDGVFAWLDCDDTNAASTTIAADADCDGSVTAADCDDGDANSTVVATDGDCDGIVTAEDCDDTDPDVTDFDGQSSDCPGLSCLGLLDGDYSVGDGTYWIDPTGVAPFEATCDMTTEGGGYDYFAVESGQSTSGASASNDCPAGTDIVFPRSRAHWVSMFALFDSSYFDAVPGVYKPSGSGDYTTCAMNSTGCPDWQVGDGGRWWLRATDYSEPSGDYTNGCWLGLNPDLGVDDLQFNDWNCGVSTTKYICSTNDKP
jgi:hypothetical protein